MASNLTRNWMSFLARMPSLFVGLFLFSAGIVANLHAGLGMMPWGVLNVGLETMTPFTLGEISQVVGIAVRTSWADASASAGSARDWMLPVCTVTVPYNPMS